MKAKATSYEIICDTARKEPITEYLELETQPDKKPK